MRTQTLTLKKSMTRPKGLLELLLITTLLTCLTACAKPLKPILQAEKIPVNEVAWAALIIDSCPANVIDGRKVCTRVSECNNSDLIELLCEVTQHNEIIDNLQAGR